MVSPKQYNNSCRIKITYSLEKKNLPMPIFPANTPAARFAGFRRPERIAYV